jgi:PAS domain S-box-containing protein
MPDARILVLGQTKNEREHSLFDPATWPDGDVELIEAGDLARGLAADVLVVGPSVTEPLSAARTFRRTNASGQVVFLLPAERLGSFERMLPFSPAVAEAWVVDAAMPAPDLRRRMEEAVAAVRSRRSIRGLYGRINAQVARSSGGEGVQDDPRRQHLALAERYLAAILNHAPDALFATTLSGAVVSWNDAAARLFGRSWDEMAGQSFVALLLPEDQLEASLILQRAGMGESIQGHELRIPGPGELVRVLEVSAAPVLGGARAIEGISLTARDITRRKEDDAALRRLNEELESRVANAIAEREQTAAALRQSQKLEAVGQLTGGVAHDFNNLLTIIKSSVEFLRRPELAEERRLRYVESISETVDRAARLTRQLLAFARRQPLNPEVFDAGERVEFVADMIRTIVGARIALEAYIECNPCYVEADASQFETALVNLAVNARDAMDGEGTLTIRLRNVAEVPPLRGHAGGKGDFLAVLISDTGSGIAPDQLGRIFEPFYTTKDVGKGTGLGLSQVYGFAKQSGGEIAVESEVGSGTTFTLYLPRVLGMTPASAESAKTLTAPDTAASPQKGRILVVEDNEDVGTFSTQMLQELGYETTWATNASAALEYLTNEPDSFDIIFSDVVMPGMSGIELGKEVRRRYPNMPVLLTSGYSHVLAEEGRHGFELLQKPYSVEELSRTLRQVIKHESRPTGAS